MRVEPLRDLKVLDAGDCEVAPPYDHADITAAPPLRNQTRLVRIRGDSSR
jgi:hypothetical protein